MKLGHVCQTSVVTTTAEATLADAAMEMRRRQVGHKAAGLPHLRPAIPTAPSTTMINFDPKAQWPQ
jgi:hypothetical protein